MKMASETPAKWNPVLIKPPGLRLAARSWWSPPT